MNRISQSTAGLVLLGQFACACGRDASLSEDAATVTGSNAAATEGTSAATTGGTASTPGAAGSDADVGGVGFTDLGTSTDAEGVVTPEGCTDDCDDIGCGNGRLDPGLNEACDDANNSAGDGCSSDCTTVETDFACPEPGRPCQSTVACGDGRVSGAETCDDANTEAEDGCSATCQVEQNWKCDGPGQACAPLCGDAVLAGAETCDPPNPGQGCSELCQLEPGYVCAPPPAAPDPDTPADCHATVCGDGTSEGEEACDDGNAVDGDGCSARCTLEPDCGAGECVSKCGDAILLAPEVCDDGNLSSGDGCSADCLNEIGYLCEQDAGALPESLNLLATYRDFISAPAGGSPRHPDFEIFAGANVTEGLTLPVLDADGKPAMAGRCSDDDPASIGDLVACPYGQMLTTESNFSGWFRDVAGTNVPVPGTLLLPQAGDGSYVYDSGFDGFYPVDGEGFVAAGEEGDVRADPGVNDGNLHNFGFTTEVRYFFQYRGGELLSFSGDDDLWVFINRTLALDVGGLHPRTDRALDVDEQADALGLEVGGVYEIAFFHAERRSTASNFQLTLTGFAPTKSNCGPTCGDGVVVGSEECDLGSDLNVGAYNGCTADCRRGPRCGDGVVQDSDEACDDGVNLSTYSMSGTPGCAPGCMLSAFCGDANVDSLFGEQCDEGTELNGQPGSACTETCELSARCGDGIVQANRGEECDDGNTISGDGCTNECLVQLY